MKIAESTNEEIILLKMADIRDNIESIIENDSGFAKIFCKEVEFFLEAIDNNCTAKYGTSKIHQSFLYKELREILNTKQSQLEK